VVVRLDRLARSVGHLLSVIEALERITIARGLARTSHEARITKRCKVSIKL
jgi:hypothetical protein